MYYGSTFKTPGRFCNHLIRNLYCHIVAEKYNVRFEYSYYDKINELGIELYNKGKKTYYNHTFQIDDENFFHLIREDYYYDYNIVYKEGYHQTSEFITYLKKYLIEKNYFKIREKNPYREKYQNNNDVFIHVRLGDVIKYNPGFEYYDKILSSIKFEKGYISSDSINHPICKKLIEKYNLQVFNEDEIKTIQFGSTCKYIVLSGGTFSWTIGFLSIDNFSQIYYPNPNNKYKWQGDIYTSFPEWNMIDY